ncbi:MAG: pyridoxamine 5'-phosphate oxidase family protein [archaeon]
MLTGDVKKLFESQDLVALATADKSSMPNVVPIYWKKIVDSSTIWLIDNYMLQTAGNLRQNKKACISFWNPSTEDAYKLKGEATYYSSGKVFEAAKKWIQSISPSKSPKGVVEFKVLEVYTIKPGPAAGSMLYDSDTKAKKTSKK